MLWQTLIKFSGCYHGIVMKKQSLQIESQEKNEKN